MKIVTLMLALTFAFLDVALAFLQLTPVAGMLIPAVAAVAAVLLIGRLVSTPLPQ